MAYNEWYGLNEIKLLETRYSAAERRCLTGTAQGECQVAAEYPQFEQISMLFIGIGRGGPSKAGPIGGKVSMPLVKDSYLKNVVYNLYKGTTNPKATGNGTSMDAARDQLMTGKLTFSKDHVNAIKEAHNGLKKWLKNSPNASYGDRLVAQSLLDEIRAIFGWN